MCVLEGKRIYGGSLFFRRAALASFAAGGWKLEATGWKLDAHRG
jgi:hypothetical protein